MAFLVYGGVGMKEKVGCQRTATAKKLLGIYERRQSGIIINTINSNVIDM
jgi:hypothetical protein